MKDPTFQHARTKVVRRFEIEWEQTAPPRVETFLEQSKAICDTDDVASSAILLALIDSDVRLREESGEPASHADYVDRFPDISAELSRRSKPTTDLAPEPTAPDVTVDLPREKKENETVDASRDLMRSTIDPNRTIDLPPGSSPSSNIPSNYGDYELLNEIARGGMGVVYKARQKKLNRVVALKMILSGQFASEGDVKRFYAEAEAAATLDHPGIVPIFDVGEAAGQHYFSMGFVEGESLSARISKGPMGPREAAAMMKKITEAVAYAHRRGIIHRDLKPHNVLLTRDGEPKVTDFGLAAKLEGEHELTTTGQILGTPGYMPPEQAQGRINDIGPESDVYSLGAVLYCLLTGRPPFQMPTMLETIKQVIESPPVSPRTLNPSTDRDVETICLKCLEKEKSNRFASAEELAAELDRYLSGEPIRSRPVGITTRATRWCKRNPLGTSLAAAMMVVCIAILLAVSFGRSAMEARRVGNLKAQFEQQLDQIEPTPQFLTDTDETLDAIEEFDPSYAENGRTRTNETFAKALRRSIMRPKLTRDVVMELDATLDTFVARDETSAKSLRQQLRNREQQWTDVVSLARPFANVSDVFATSITSLDATENRITPTRLAFKFADERRQKLPPPPKDEKRELLSPSVATKVVSSAFTSIEVRYATNWQDASSLGVALNATGRSAYDFVLIAPQSVPNDLGVSDGDETTTSTIPGQRKVIPGSFLEARRRRRAVRCEIRRGHSILLAREIPIREIPPGELVVRATREANVVSFQINTRPVESFRDPFPLSTKDAGVCAIRWPERVGLLGLKIRGKARPPTPSELEQGDDLFDQQRYAEALNFYHDQALELEGEFRSEAMYKEAICLTRLGRDSEAETLLSQVFNQEGKRWPALAGCQLWLMKILEDDIATADSFLDALQLRFDFRQLARSIPDDVRSQILKAYQSEMGTFSGMTSYNPQLVQRIKRVAAVDRLFSDDGLGKPFTQVEVSRAYRFVGDLPTAMTHIQPLLDRKPLDSLVLRHYFRLLRLLGRPDQALTKYQEIVEPDAELASTSVLRMELPRIYAALGRWDKCEAVLDWQMAQIDDATTNDHLDLTFYRLMKGFLLERRGLRGEATAMWRKGYQGGRALVGHQQAPTQDVVNTLIMGSLSDSLEEDDTSAYLRVLSGSKGNSPLISLARTLINPKTLHVVFSKMWRSDRGRKYAEQIAFESLTMQERIRIPAQLIAVEFLRETGMPGDMTPDQEQFAFESAETLFKAAVFDGRMTAAQAAQFAVAWKGSSFFFGWKNMERSLDDDLVRPTSYFAGLRYLRLKKPKDARELLESSVKHAADHPLLMQLAREQLTLLDNSVGQILLRAEFEDDVEVIVATDDDEVQRVRLKSDAQLQLPPGQYTLTCADERQIRIVPSTIRIDVGQHRVVEVTEVWSSPWSPQPQVGLVHQPSEEVANGRWQILRRHPGNFIHHIAASPDGRRYATGDQIGVTRIMDAETHELLHVMNSLPSTIRGLDWHPTSSELLVWGYGLEVHVVDGQRGETLRRVKLDYAAVDLRWSPDGDSILVATEEPALHRLGTHGREIWKTPVERFSVACRWSPDGRFVAMLTKKDGNVQLRIQSAEDGSLVERLQVGGDVRAAIEWSPDSERIAIGGLDCVVRVWTRADWTAQPAEFSEAKAAIHGLQWANSRELLVVDKDARRYLVAVPSMNVVRQNEKPFSHTRDIEILPRTDRLLIATHNPYLLSTTLTGDESREISPRPRPAKRIGVAPDRQSFAISREDGTTWVFDQQGRIKVVVDTSPHNAPEAVLSPQGKKFAVPVSYREIHIYDVDGTLISTLEYQAKSKPHRLAWSNDGRHLAALYGAEIIHVWNFSDEKIAATWNSETHAAASLAWFDDQQLLIGTKQGVLLRWNLDGSTPHEISVGNERVADILPSPDRTRLLTRDDDRIWTIRNADGHAVRRLDQEGGSLSADWRDEGTRISVMYRSKLAQFAPDGNLKRKHPGTPRIFNHGRSLGRSSFVDVDLGGEVRIRDVASGDVNYIICMRPNGHYARFSGRGQLLDYHGDLASTFVYTVETTQAGNELLTPQQFHQRFGLPMPKESDSPVRSLSTQP